MQTFMTLLIAVIGSSSVSTIVVAILHRRWEKEDRCAVTKDDLKPIMEQLNALKENQKVASVDRIRHIVKAHIAEGCIDLEEKENIMSMYRSYKSLGGNGHLDTVMSELEKIPVVDK